MDLKVNSGIESLNNLSVILKSDNVECIFLVTGKSSYYKSTANKLLESILSEFKIVHFFDFEENPKIEDLKKGISIFNANKCDAIIAIGGGSVIDMAKLIKSFHEVTYQIEVNIINNIVNNSDVKFIAIPTTSGSGSEATHFAVVYHQQKKYSVASLNLLPDYVFLIPELTFSASPYLTAITGLDAFSQAIESWWSVNSTDESIKYSKEAAKIIFNNLDAAIKNCPTAKQEIQKASYLAGKAINIAKTTGPHALSYGFTTYCQLPHGHAVSLLLPSFVRLHMEVNSVNCIDPRGEMWVKIVMLDIAKLLDINFDILDTEISNFIQNCGVLLSFNELKISKLLFDKSVLNVNRERLKNNPVHVSSSFINQLFYAKFNNVI